jgi:hypothetical protein
LEYLPVVRVSPGAFEHAWQVAAAAVALHRHLPGGELISDREIKAREIASKGELCASAQIGRIGDRRKLHRPDLAAISTSGRMLAIEVELSAKAPGRLAQICRGWTRARHVDHVYYLATPKAERAVQRAVSSVKGDGFITVLPLDGVATLAVQERNAHSRGMDADQQSAGWESSVSLACDADLFPDGQSWCNVYK